MMASPYYIGFEQLLTGSRETIQEKSCEMEKNIKE